MKSLFKILAVISLPLQAIAQDEAQMGIGTEFLVIRSPMMVTSNSLTNLRVLSVLATNWLPMSVAQANGDGTTRNKAMEVGIVVSNRYAQVWADGESNQVLISSTPIATTPLLLREKPALTNSIVFGWSWPNVIHPTNGIAIAP